MSINENKETKVSRKIGKEVQLSLQLARANAALAESQLVLAKTRYDHMLSDLLPKEVALMKEQDPELGEAIEVNVDEGVVYFSVKPAEE